jgi:hypothetical protein
MLFQDPPLFSKRFLREAVGEINCSEITDRLINNPTEFNDFITVPISYLKRSLDRTIQ